MGPRTTHYNHRPVFLIFITAVPVGGKGLSGEFLTPGLPFRSPEPLPNPATPGNPPPFSYRGRWRFSTLTSMTSFEHLGLNNLWARHSLLALLSPLVAPGPTEVLCAVNPSNFFPGAFHSGRITGFPWMMGIHEWDRVNSTSDLVTAI